MTGPAATRLFRERLLEGRTVAVAGGAGGAVAGGQVAGGADYPVAAALAALGATITREPDGGPPLDVLVYDAREAFGGGSEALLTVLGEAWAAVHAAANGAMIPARRGKIVLIGPPPGAGRFAAAARAGLENLARTLSIEWARYGITVTMLAPRERATGEQLAVLACFLACEAGDYFSGCRIELGASA